MFKISKKQLKLNSLEAVNNFTKQLIKNKKLSEIKDKDINFLNNLILEEFKELNEIDYDIVLGYITYQLICMGYNYDYNSNKFEFILDRKMAIE